MNYSELVFDECRSYINSYLANGAVIVPGYNHERDEWAIETYEEIYPLKVQISDIVGLESIASPNKNRRQTNIKNTLPWMHS